MKFVVVILVAVLSLVTGFVVHGYIQSENVPYETILSAVVSLIGTFAGAYFAFQLHAVRERRLKTEQQVAAGNRALFALFYMWRVVHGFRVEYMAPVIQESYQWDKTTSWVDVYPSQPSSLEKMQIEKDELNFLLDSKTPEIFNKLALLEKNYNKFVELESQRSETMSKNVLPRMKEYFNTYVEGGQSMELENPLTRYDYKRWDFISRSKVYDVVNADEIKYLTSQVLFLAEENNNQLRQCYEELRAALNQVLSGHKIARYNLS